MVSPETALSDDGPAPPDEIARILAAMNRLMPLEIPADVTADLDAWERKLNQGSIDHTDAGELAFRAEGKPGTSSVRMNWRLG